VTIEKGKEWGHRITAPPVVLLANSDRDLAEQWTRQTDGIFRVTDGDLFSALGCPTWDDPAAELQLLPIDVIEVQIIYDNSAGNDNPNEVNSSENAWDIRYAISSVQVGKWLSRGRFVCVSNTGFIDRYNIAPRAHPNDGEIDVVTISSSMDWRQRIQARGRARVGNHVPHPDISMQRGTEAQWSKERSGESLRVDGQLVKGWHTVSVRVLPDACRVVV